MNRFSMVFLSRIIVRYDIYVHDCLPVLNKLLLVKVESHVIIDWDYI